VLYHGEAFGENMARIVLAATSSFEYMLEIIIKREIIGG